MTEITAKQRGAYVVTGATSGIGRATALELARHGTVILVGRDRKKLDDLQHVIEQRKQKAISVLCDLSDPASVQRASAEIVALQLPIVGLLNNAGIMQTSIPTKNALGWDMTFSTNHLGPFILTEALMPHLPDNANVLFVVSAIEDPERSTVKAMKMGGGRYISAEASARGEWAPGGSNMSGIDSYATSKQSCLAAAMVLARENPRLRINAIEPGITPGTGLGGGSNVFLSLLFQYVITFFPPFLQYRSTPERAARVIAALLTGESVKTGGYFDQKGDPMLGSELVRDPKFQERVVAETRALLSKSLITTNC